MVVLPSPGIALVGAKLPAGITSGEFAARLIEDTGVVVTPGAAYGPSGEGYIRISLTVPDERLEEALNRLSAFARGDYLRRAWFLIGLCMALLLVRDATVNVPAVGGWLPAARWADRGIGSRDPAPALTVNTTANAPWGTP